MINKSKKILSEISAGELLDKISILEIKLNKIKNKDGLVEIKKDYDSLKMTRESNIKMDNQIHSLFEEIKKVNSKLWDIENGIRECEKTKNFSEKFIELSRAVYINNDKRAKIKLQINEKLGSNIKEIKQYSDY